MSRIRIGRVWIDSVTFEEALSAIESLIGRGGAVFTPNVDHVVTAEKNPEFAAAYEFSDVSLADGQWVVWAARMLGTPLPAKISGSDLTLPLAKRLGASGRSIYLLGGAKGAAEKAAQRLGNECQVRIAGIYDGRIDLTKPDVALIGRIQAARPDVVLVALGSPKQELWIHRNREALAPAVLLGVGATLDFLAGQVRRAPPWISKAGMEWLFRLSLEPKRLSKRYLVDDPRFAVIVLQTLREPRDGRVTAEK
ncbi:MAG TPA: WecB/TagA/CpsF family glycosyltransferase [Myxococcales bacterium]|jgi:N-acetylglucosaminyldiphosphoundecaprenol N-acetyl-beta-D-mannosaminyltransferase